MIIVDETLSAARYVNNVLTPELLPLENPRFETIFQKDKHIPDFSQNSNQQAFDLKLRTLKQEALRCCTREQEAKLSNLNRLTGYEYLKLTRQGEEDTVRPFIDLVDRAVREEERTSFKRHMVRNGVT